LSLWELRKMGTASYIKGLLVATWSGVRHIFRPRMTLRYPEQKLDLEGPGYRYDPRQGVGLPGFKGRHILYMDKCTGCQLCAIACDGVAVAIEMQHIPKGKPQNKKEIWPAVDYGRCVPPWTPVTTSGGVVPISEIRVGDKVLTHAGRFRTVTEVFRRKHTGRIYTFRTLGNPEPLTVTEGHPILVRRQEGLVWAMPDQIEKGDNLTSPIVKAEVDLLQRYDGEEKHATGGASRLTPGNGWSDSRPELVQLVGYSETDTVHFSSTGIKEIPVADIAARIAAMPGRGVPQKAGGNSAGLNPVGSSRIAVLSDRYSCIPNRPGVVSAVGAAGQESVKYGVAEQGGVQARNGLTLAEGRISMADGMILSPVVEVTVEDVEDFDVLNLEVEYDNTYVASNHVVHNCVFCGLCVDACPFDALFMTNDYELAGYDKESLKYSPDQLAMPPKLEGQTFKVKIDTEKGTVKHA
jgi:formate hydrogenlyase subunit 6/NADH:ubiquinone oxidoreductase subunit I